jgi:hypothetical protein
MTANKDHGADVPAWKLERFALGELPADELARLRERLEADADLRRQLEGLRAADADIRQAYPAPWIARQIRSRAGPRAWGPNGRVRANAWWNGMKRWSLVPVAAAALLALAVVPSLQDSHEVTEPLALRSTIDGVRAKGDGARLFVHRKAAGGSERLEDGSAARPGDALRLQYATDTAAFGAILSIDGRGVVTLHLPQEGTTAAALQPGAAVSLASSYVLDDAPHWESFYLVSSETGFVLAPVLEAARAAAAQATAAPDSLQLPIGLDQVRVTLTKLEAPR